MLVSLFSIFDPSLSLFLLSWMPVILSMCVVGVSSFNFLSGSNVFTAYLINLFGSMVGGFQVSNLPLFIWLSCVFLYVSIVNLISLFPYSFSANSQISLVFPLSVFLWLSFVLFSLNNSFTDFINNLTPQGSPYSIMNFIVLVELVSILIRPITLSIRLVSNIVAGHLLMSILVSFLLSSGHNEFFVIVVIMNLLEIGVSLIQGYVFSILLLMYYSD